jgi:predicted O-methyltransferase YrrM
MISLERLFNEYGSDKSSNHAYHVPYEILTAGFRETATSILEIGVYKGGSIRAWQEYFPSAKIVGIDCKPACSRYMPRGAVFELGSQDDTEFLEGVAKRHGPFDMVIDDGSHRPAHQMVAFNTLMTHLKPGGLYVIEDVHFGILRPRRYNKANVKTPFDEMVAWAKTWLGTLDATPGQMITFYRNGIFILDGRRPATND